MQSGSSVLNMFEKTFVNLINSIFVYFGLFLGGFFSSYGMKRRLDVGSQWRDISAIFCVFPEYFQGRSVQYNQQSI